MHFLHEAPYRCGAGDHGNERRAVVKIFHGGKFTPLFNRNGHRSEIKRMSGDWQGWFVQKYIQCLVILKLRRPAKVFDMVVGF